MRVGGVVKPAGIVPPSLAFTSQELLPLDEHRHDDVGVIGAAVGAEDALGGGAGSFEGDAAFAEGLKDIGEVLAVKGDLDAFALDGGVDFALVVADLIGPGGDRHLSRRDALAGGNDQTHDAGAVTRENGGYTGLAEE